MTRSGRSIEANLASVNPRSPGFGSWTMRKGAGNRNISPSPGSHDAALNQTLEARSKRSFNTSASMGKSSFGTFVPRLQKGKAGEGGDPGAYSIENQGVHSGKAEHLVAQQALVQPGRWPWTWFLLLDFRALEDPRRPVSARRPRRARLFAFVCDW